ncbi:hypothetical protein P170DRAFT_473670 [Aspergillus steynii IBT 23096]|uniref:Xylanolytic transcriptional activator regulatory domain-containing protein n=1 Tax=Aspergillus steynii IBT 23096 TaxID=1392250 RepID=A0A2I2GB36_9EURO|nr:uncharacterized protein P170DRAFT_473670 [Aspergillus steynii IBT 23096]PLB50094.1 hypothetical protein P170DRAFT_473670 [Aspergillus steynii IBT 23096]
MYYAPRRTRTAESGACSYCVAQRERCYTGVRGIPCSNCRRLNLICDGNPSTEVESQKHITPLAHCAEDTFASQIQKAGLELVSRQNPIPAVAATAPLDNYLSIVDEFLGPTRTRVPKYVAELPNRLGRDDLDYLERKGALSLPSDQLRAELLKSYILWVHPQVPVLDPEAFLCAITGTRTDSGISLLLFQAVMFAAAAFVDISHLRNAGYSSRKAARDTLFRRVKTLLELDCEDDRLVTIQSLLLLIHWHDLPNEEKDANHWMGVCLSLAMSIGLHRNPDSEAMTPSQQQIWRRTWWSMHNHSRLTAEDLLSMMSIEDREDGALSDITMVTLKDFNFGVFSREARSVVNDESDVLRSTEYQRTQAIVFIEKTRLCRVSQFSRISNHISRMVFGTETHESTSLERSPPDPNEAEHLDLHRWLSQLSAAGRYHYPLMLMPSEWDRSIYLHRTWVRLLYLGSAYAACGDGRDGLGNASIDSITPRSEHSCQYVLDMTDIFDEVQSLGLSDNLPSPCMALLILSFSFHRRSVELETPSARTVGARALHKCWNGIRQLQETSVLGRRMVLLVEDNVRADIWDL